MTRALFPGSFDPITLGHVDVIRRARSLFEQVVVGVGANPSKQPMFDVDQRIELIRAALEEAKVDQVEVVSFLGLAVAAARTQGCACLIRGVRGVSDMDFESAMAQTNRQLDPGVETVLMLPSAETAYVASTLVRDAARHGGDVSNLVPAVVAAALRRARESGER